jgi:excisionase family DNA binding protein
MSEQLLRVEEARARLRISRGHLYELLRRGELKSVLLSPRVRRIPESAVDDLIARRLKGSA